MSTFTEMAGLIAKAEADRSAVCASSGIYPRNDRVLIRRIEEQKNGIVITDADKSQKGIVLKVGEGKWIPGEWWKVKREIYGPMKGSNGRSVLHDEYVWEWIDGWRRTPEVRPGQHVLFNSKWNDFAEDFYDNLPVGADKTLHLVMEADILAVINA